MRRASGQTPLVIVDYNAQTLEKHVASTLIIGKVMGTEDRAEKLIALYKEKIADTLLRVKSASQPERPKAVQQKRFGPLVDRMVKTLKAPKHCD